MAQANTDKRLSVKVGTYIKEGKTVGKYQEIGILKDGEDGQYILLDPSLSLAGLLAKQNKMAFDSNGVMRDNVMVGVFSKDNN